MLASTWAGLLALALAGAQRRAGNAAVEGPGREADAGSDDLMTLRDLAEFDGKNRLLAVPGVAGVERLGR